MVALCLCVSSADALQSGAGTRARGASAQELPGVIQIEQGGQLLTTHARGLQPPAGSRDESGVRSQPAAVGSREIPTGQQDLGQGTCDSPNQRSAGSLLLFPEYDNRASALTLFTVTNTSATESVDVEYVYVGRYGPSVTGGVANGEFDNGGAGWTIDVSPPNGGPVGTVTFGAGQAQFLENYSLLTTLSQTFVMPAGAATLEFDLFTDPGFDLSGGFVPDAFEAQLLDGSNASVVSTWNPGATSFFNIQEDLASNLGSGTSYSGTRVSVDVSGVASGQSVTLFFDLIGPDSDYASGVKIGNVHLTSSTSADQDCSEFNRTEHLTPGDTLTLFTNYHNPDDAQGYAYVFAKGAGGQPIAFNYLVGNLMAMSGVTASNYSMNAVSFGSPLQEGESTDLDSDGIRDLNGLEYQEAPAEILIPRFIGQGNGIESELILIALSGGTAFDTTLDFLIFNDNEEGFSTEYTFHCWDRVALLDISLLFSNGFLANGTNQDPLETIGSWESGWIRIDGANASSSSYSIADPAFYAVQIENVQGFSAASLPFELCTQPGHLLPRGVNGDNEE